jgi:alkylation response protein AidB-like acyl-CoA dehydrogenase
VPVVAKDDADETVIVFVERHAKGLTVIDDWSSFGQRTTASGTTTIDDVAVEDWHILPHQKAFDRPTTMGPIAQIIQGGFQGRIDRPYGSAVGLPMG